MAAAEQEALAAAAVAAETDTAAAEQENNLLHESFDERKIKEVCASLALCSNFSSLLDGVWLRNRICVRVVKSWNLN
jgi:hypothetical protein